MIKHHDKFRQVYHYKCEACKVPLDRLSEYVTINKAIHDGAKDCPKCNRSYRSLKKKNKAGE